MHFLSMCLSSIIVITNNNGDSTSPWKTPLWILISCCQFKSVVFHGIFDNLSDFARYLIDFNTFYYQALRDHIKCLIVLLLIIILLFTLREFFPPALADAFYWSLSDSKYPQVSWTILSILADLNNQSCSFNSLLFPSLPVPLIILRGLSQMHQLQLVSTWFSCFKVF